MECDERPFEERTFQECNRRFAVTHDDRLVRIEDYIKQHYWGGKRLEVREVFIDAAGLRMGPTRWDEEDERLTPAFPDQPGWMDRVQALRAEKVAARIAGNTAPAPSPPSPRRV